VVAIANVGEASAPVPKDAMVDAEVIRERLNGKRNNAKQTKALAPLSQTVKEFRLAAVEHNLGRNILGHLFFFSLTV